MRASIDERAPVRRLPLLHRQQRDRRGAGRREGRLSTRTLVLVLVSIVGLASTLAMFLLESRVEHLVMGGY